MAASTYRPRPQPVNRHAVRRPLANFRRNHTSPFRHVDVVLVACIGLVCLFGALMVYSTTRGAEPPYDASFLKRVVMFLILGGLVMAGAAFFDYRKLRDYWPFIYGGSVLLLFLVLVPGIGKSTNGTQGWFQLGPFQLQPSELAKLGMIIGFSGLASQFRGDLDNARVGMLLGLCGAPMFFVLLQPDLGTTLVSVAVAFALLLVAGVRPRILGLLALAAIVGTTLILTSGVLKDYQVARLTTYVKQDQVATSKADRDLRLNLEQAKSAIGSGGLTGKGLFNGPLTRGKVVPEQQTDFIFTAVGEQLGLLGCGALLTLLGVIVWRVWRAAQLARDDFGMLLCTGIMVMLVVQVFENVGMTMGIMPITGIPLPFMSYGGSALMTSLLSMGLVLSVHMRRFS
ncbi:rod shape-determining protein RodA [Aquihabitans sp. G128]|uniref:FtsW/RodA/SpoVE family cell cycle protein n=1 Tax=Aquihabitans sp. G128 TaxID=2849779 RepID=UPI001C23074F|nr:FtsW/RodA/SpoVE family cell cycle protein [Aquihabitans sp. G128]QXC62722.1 rod shape-determining protein RodA [Aquihabitans sp. G128]